MKVQKMKRDIMTDTSTQVFRNYYTFENDLSLTNDASGVRFGRSITQYEIRRRRDVKNLDSIMGYVLMMKQRIIIPSTTCCRGSEFGL